jgi:hypothetical protein
VKVKRLAGEPWPPEAMDEVKEVTEEVAVCYRDMALYGRRCAAAHVALAETYEKLAAETSRLARLGGPLPG